MTIIYLDHKYVGFASTRLKNFARKGQGLYLCACPACGDSKRKSKAAHCYLFETRDGIRAYCHRCGWSVSMGRFLRTIDEEMYRDYLMERFDDGSRERERIVEEVARSAPVPRSVPEWRRGLERVDLLEDDHPARLLVESRGIPRDRWPELWHAQDFPSWASSVVDDPERYSGLRSEPRLVIPFTSGDTLAGFQGRSYEPDARVRYITASVDQTAPFLYGLDRLGPGDVVAVEGPIDSTFLRNGVASGGGVITRELKRAGIDQSRVIVAYDNEPRSPHTLRKMERALAAGYRVFVWPEGVADKDFNDWHSTLLRRGVRSPIDVIMRAVNERSFSDMEADLEITSWRKC